MKNPPKTQETTTESLLAKVLGTLEYGHDAIRKEIELISKGKAEDNGHDRASRIAFLTSRLASIVDSIRKVEAARTKAAASVSRAQVLAFLRGLEPAEQTQIYREAQTASQKRGVLG